MQDNKPQARRSAPSRDDAQAYVAERTSVAAPVAAAFDAPYDPDRPDHEPGQVWRLEWDGRVELAALIAVDADTVKVVPVGDDPEFADPATVVVAGDESLLGYSFGLWVALEQTVPRVVLDLPLGSLPPSVAGLVTQVRRSLRTTDPLPSDARLGPALPDGAGLEHPVLAYRQELQRRVTALADVASLFDEPAPAPATPAGTAVETPPSFYRLERGGGQPRDAPTGVSGGLWRLLTERGLADRAADELWLGRQDRVSLSRGRLPLTPGEVSRVASLLGVPADEVAEMVPQVDPQLLAVLHEPRRRAQVARKARELGATDTDARRQVMRDVVGAGRRERAGGPTDWEAVLDAYFGEDA